MNEAGYFSFSFFFFFGTEKKRLKGEETLFGEKKSWRFREKEISARYLNGSCADFLCVCVWGGGGPFSANVDTGEDEICIRNVVAIKVD